MTQLMLRPKLGLQHCDISLNYRDSAGRIRVHTFGPRSPGTACADDTAVLQHCNLPGDTTLVRPLPSACGMLLPTVEPPQCIHTTLWVYITRRSGQSAMVVDLPPSRWQRNYQCSTASLGLGQPPASNLRQALSEQALL
jgi:hypothetical protein